MQYVYKVCSTKEWADATEVGFFLGSEVDINDGFIHLSTITQIEVTVSKHFAGQKNLVIIQFDVKKLENKLKWEPSRDGDLFPHYYGNIKTNLEDKRFNLDLGINGIHKFPENFFT
jgi:uncharacterized protein (DUF952 family)|tara:strand:- start:742 stop:1089 length:348 start_codon:yes stop_codon:yes gene_type:complete